MKSILKTITIASIVLMSTIGIGHAFDEDEIREDEYEDLWHAANSPSSSYVIQHMVKNSPVLNKEPNYADPNFIIGLRGFVDMKKWFEELEGIPVGTYRQYPAGLNDNPYALDMIVTNIINEDFRWRECHKTMRSIRQMGQLAVTQLTFQMMIMGIDQSLLPADKNKMKKGNFDEITITQGMIVSYHGASIVYRCILENTNN